MRVEYAFPRDDVREVEGRRYGTERFLETGCMSLGFLTENWFQQEPPLAWHIQGRRAQQDSCTRRVFASCPANERDIRGVGWGATRKVATGH